MRQRALPHSPSLTAAEAKATYELNEYCKTRQGKAAELSRQSGILPAVISRMCKGATITLESAMLIEVATGGILTAELLCPSRAELLRAFRARSAFNQVA